MFTSHDLTTMSNDVLRRDEIWFSAINGYDESVLYSLVDFRKEISHAMMKIILNSIWKDDMARILTLKN